MNWLLIRTDHAKEAYVARQIQNLGFDAWVPSQVIIERHKAARRHMDRSNVKQPKTRPVCPTMLFATVPVNCIDEIVSIRHLRKIEQTAQGLIAVVPHSQIRVFMDAIEAENTLARVLSEASRRKQKPVWRSLQDGLLELAASVTGQAQEAA